VILETQTSWRWLRIGFWACIVISVAVVLRRAVALAHPSQSAPPQLAALDAAFASGRVGEVRRLCRRDDVPEEDCWVRGPGWCLAYR